MFTCRIVTYAEELASAYICYATGNWFNTPLSGYITSMYGTVCVCVDGGEVCTIPSNPLY